MKRLVPMASAILLCAITSIVVAQDTSAEPAKEGPMVKLRADLIKGVENGHLSDAQKTTMQNAGAVLRKVAQARQSGGSVDRSAVKKALSDIKGIVNSDAFEPEDQAAVKADLEALKEKAKEARQGQGRRRGRLSNYLP